MQRLLVVEDDLVISQLLERFLSDENFLVDVVSDGCEAVQCIQRDQPALVLLDKRLPGLDGIDVCHAVRPKFEKPILMLTANDDELTEVAALNAGIDDYLSKPVRPYVLLARIRALLRRSQLAKQVEPDVGFRVQDLIVNTEARSITQDGRNLSLSDSEFQLLWLLCERAGSVVSRDSLHNSLRGVEAKALDRSVDMRISKLRKRLGDVHRPYRYIRTIRSTGYILMTVDSA